jgi:hypothetical protein
MCSPLMECTDQIILTSCAAWFIRRFVSQCFGYDPCLFRHGVHLQYRCDFQLVGLYPCFEMSCSCDPHFSCCGWRVGRACDHWWLFSLLWLLCLGHMHFDLLCYLSGLYLSCGVSKLNWWNLVFSTSGEIGVFCWVGIFGWVWRLLCFTLGSVGVWSFALRNLMSWLLPFWVWNLMFATHMAWFEGELMLWHVYCIVRFYLAFFHTHLSHFASHVILVCICLIMLITALGWVVMRCEPLC